MGAPNYAGPLTARELLARARYDACRAAPYLARALWAMTFLPNEDVGTIGIDEHWRVSFHPAYVDKCHRQKTLVGEIIHECLHPTLRHKQRAILCHATDHSRWNACGDAELDQQIEAMGVKLVENRIRPEHLGGQPKQTAEELYQLCKPKSCGRCAGGTGAGNPQPWEQKAKAGAKGPGGGNDVPVPGGLSEAEAELIRTTVAAAVKDYDASRPGKVPAGILRWAETFGTAIPLDFRTLVQCRLAYMLDTRRGAHPTYSRPARRRLPGGLVLPVHRTALPTLVIVGDTSRSMRERDLGLVISAVWEACNALGHVKVVPCDAEAYELVDCMHIDDLRPHLVGGGGTEMSIGIAAADEASPDGIVVVTDGLTDWPAEPPEAPVTILLTRASTRDACPPWADVVVLADDDD